MRAASTLAWCPCCQRQLVAPSLLARPMAYCPSGCQDPGHSTCKGTPISQTLHQNPWRTTCHARPLLKEVK